MAYRYEAYTQDKRIVRGTVDAASEGMAESILYEAGYSRILKLREILPGSSLEELLPSLYGVKTGDVVQFSRHLATLIESGMPIVTALGLLEKQERKVALKKVIAEFTVELQGGSSFSQALSKYPQAFPNIYCQVVKASEYTGNLATALRQAAGYLERNLVMTAKVRQALAYPSLVALMAVGVVALITNVAFPPLVRLFASLGAELPWSTRLIMQISGFVSSYNVYLLGGLFISIALVASYLRLPAGQLAKDRLMLKIPRIDRISMLRNMHRFCRTMSLLLEAGLPLPQIMSTVIDTVSNRIIRQALVEVREKLVQGQGLSQPMASAGLFPDLLVAMTLIGEKTGTLPSVLGTLADLYEQTVEQEVRILIAIVQNVLILGTGAVVGFIGISMITPLYSILKAIR